MPAVMDGESQEDYLHRCIPYIIKEKGVESDQATAICHSLYDHHTEQTEPQMNTQTLTEDFQLEEAIHKDGVIENVKILGWESKNGRTYSREAVIKAAPMYEGAIVFSNHLKKGESRKAEDYFGRIHGVRVAEDGLRGNLEYYPGHKLAGVVKFAAEKNWKGLGLSHSVDGKTSDRGGKITVESLDAIHSVDVVASPATCETFTEQQNMDDTRLTALEEQVKSLVESNKTLVEKLKSPWAPKPTATDPPAEFTEQKLTKVPTTVEEGRKFMRSK